MLNMVWIVTTKSYNQPLKVFEVLGGAIGKGGWGHDGRI